MHLVRAAVGVSFRWVSLLPPSLLQPRVSPMGCDGIRYSMNMQPKKRSGVLPGKELAPCSGPVLLTSAGKKTQPKLKIGYFQLQVEKNCLFNFYFSASSKKPKSPSMCFLAEMPKVRARMKERREKSEKSSLCRLQAVQTQV